jgi:hypothetical protein
LSVPFLVGTLLALIISVYIHVTLPRGMDYPIIFPSVTILFAVAFVHLILLGVFSELVVKVGDFKESETVLSVLDSGGQAA